MWLGLRVCCFVDVWDEGSDLCFGTAQLLILSHAVANELYHAVANDLYCAVADVLFCRYTYLGIGKFSSRRMILSRS